MDFKAVQNYWTDHEPQGKKMPPAQLRQAIVDFVKAHNTMALATGCGSFVRNTPLEYEWYQDAFWILTEGGIKFHALEHNLNVCVAIFDPLGEGIHGLQVMGTVEIVDPESEDYRAYLDHRHIGAKALSRMPYPMPMLRVVPVEADFLDSSLARDGFSVRQHCVFQDP